MRLKRSYGLLWRWNEKDFGFRYLSGSGKKSAEYYQTEKPNEYYHVPASQRKFKKERLSDLCHLFPNPAAPKVIANPWNRYNDSDWQMIDTRSGICLNWAGCLDKREINLRETHGVNRAKEYVVELAVREEPAPITLDFLQRIHREIFSDIYPWAGEWRTVTLSKAGISWNLPPTGLEPVMAKFENDVLSKTPFVSEDDDAVFDFLGELLGEYIAIHPFREGNGRSAFLLSDLVLLQNGLLPLNHYNRNRDKQRYYDACEAARVKLDYQPLSELLRDWEQEAQAIYAESLEPEDDNA
jgi:cell filamentation protein